tara:strand:- start:338 stop:526 length:189 start_codon:yes stop_codon:yes gene_type:complete
LQQVLVVQVLCIYPLQEEIVPLRVLIQLFQQLHLLAEEKENLLLELPLQLVLLEDQGAVDLI